MRVCPVDESEKKERGERERRREKEIKEKKRGKERGDLDNNARFLLI